MESIQATPNQLPASQQPEAQNAADQTSAATTASKPSNKTVSIIVGSVVLFVLLTAAYFMGARGMKVVAPTQEPSIPSVSTTPVTTPVAQEPLFTGTVKKLDQDLKIFLVTENDKLNPDSVAYSYFSAGTFARGELQGYTRIVALKQEEGPGGPTIYFLATKDYQTYVLNGSHVTGNSYIDNTSLDPYTLLDKTKISSTKVFDTEQPLSLNLDTKFALYSQAIPTTYTPTNKKDSYGNTITVPVILTDFSGYKKLDSPFATLTLYFQPYAKQNPEEKNLSALEKESRQIENQYLVTDTYVDVLDSTGLPMLYRLTTPSNIAMYTSDKAQYDSQFAEYLKNQKRFENHEISDYPKSPDFLYPPSMNFKISSLENTVKTSLYTKYQTAFPGGCAFDGGSEIVNVQDSQLEQIGTVAGQPVYHLKDPKHALNRDEYIAKVAMYNDESKMFQDANPGVNAPTFEEYTAKNPLLFVKDYWGRWVVLGEYDYILPGGCGKPVVYLYPTEPTEVTVKFLAPMQFTTDIPTYGDSWKVLAQPNGLLTNLRPELTNCDTIDTTHPGAEYAKEACQKNTYPYLYWAGNVVSQNYPQMTQGWVVEKTKVAGFLSDKATSMGLNATEKKDFLEYWVPELTNKNAPYYRISFLQTRELNALFPMSVTPQPDTTFRIFLDYVPLAEKPAETPEPQQLNKLERHGFTLVEWGGLKRP